MERERLFLAFEKKHCALQAPSSSAGPASDWLIASLMFRFARQPEYEYVASYSKGRYRKFNPSAEERHYIVRAYWLARTPGNMMWIPDCDPRGLDKKQLIDLCRSLGNAFAKLTEDRPGPIKLELQTKILDHFTRITKDKRLTEFHETAISYQHCLINESLRFLDLPHWNPHYDFPLSIGNGQCTGQQIYFGMVPPWMPFGVGFHRFLPLVGEFRDGGYHRGAFFDEAKRAFWDGLCCGLETVNPVLRDWVMDKNNAGLIQQAVCMGVMMDALFVVTKVDCSDIDVYRNEILIEALPVLLSLNYTYSA